MPDITPPLPGTVKFYERHLFVCTNDSDWPQRIELDGDYLQQFSELIARYVLDMPLKVKMTACVDPGLTAESANEGYDILVFPDMVRYVGVETADFETLVIDHLVGNKVSVRLTHEPLTGHHLFVCVHGRRDVRCGECGPPLIDKLQAELDQQFPGEKATVYPTSHVGGHVYAGNLLIYPGGDWYGYVTPDNVSSLIEQHLGQGQIVWNLWRGRMGMAAGAQFSAVRRNGRKD